MMEATDWDQYYRNTPSFTSVTRAISSRKIIGLLRKHTSRLPMTICEIGGANSCFVEAVCAELDVSRYHVVDFNEYGLKLLAGKTIEADLTSEWGDVLVPYEGQEQFDMVYSVGLIEHFMPDDTARAIAQHFTRCKPGGTVLITFPTPTLPYRVIRALAEKTGKWAFPDERPLRFDEVVKEVEKYGSVAHRSINWWIGLTQGYVVIRKR